MLYDPTLNNIIKNGAADNLELQKYLLATGLLQDGIQQSLDMIVTDGGFNDVSVRRVLDAKYPSIMKKPNPIDVVFKGKVKFDVKNPVTGSLVAQVQKNKKTKKKWKSNSKPNEQCAFYKRYLYRWTFD